MEDIDELLRLTKESDKNYYLILNISNQIVMMHRLMEKNTGEYNDLCIRCNYNEDWN